MVVCLCVEGDGPEVTRLKRVGVCGGRRLEIVHAGDPMILRVAGTQIGLSRQLARTVFVEPAEIDGNDRAHIEERKNGVP
jgi:Fe2+ transport system protein FeoA